MEEAEVVNVVMEVVVDHEGEVVEVKEAVEVADDVTKAVAEDIVEVVVGIVEEEEGVINLEAVEGEATNLEEDRIEEVAVLVDHKDSLK